MNHLKEVLGVKSSTVSRWLKIASERIVETKLLLKHELNMSDENIAALLASLKNISIKSKTIK
ncbi:hypothetical protein [Desulfobacterium sp. N47]|uniref:Uncharacterized protein n=1 Tax=uncultured Desulfobacterium sp. TaxID=201089 RepID=E1YKW5_9BACT|nr:unknown protein [uncultured Desulfobacterium sp.]